MKFRKKPVVIEAVQLLRTTQSLTDVSKFANLLVDLKSQIARDKWYEYASEMLKEEGIIIPTLEGDHLARWGDWIIKGVHGEFYPCKPDIFVKTYELVQE